MKESKSPRKRLLRFLGNKTMRGAHDFDDADDFADEWEDDFEDWEDAYEYWEDHH